MKRNATAIAEKMKNNHIQSNSNYEDNEIDQDLNQNKKMKITLVLFVNFFIKDDQKSVKINNKKM